MQCNNRNNATRHLLYIFRLGPICGVWSLSTFRQEASRKWLRRIQLPRILCIAQKHVISRFTQSRTSTNYDSNYTMARLPLIQHFYLKTDAFFLFWPGCILSAIFFSVGVEERWQDSDVALCLFPDSRLYMIPHSAPVSFAFRF